MEDEIEDFDTDEVVIRRNPPRTRIVVDLSGSNSNNANYSKTIQRKLDEYAFPETDEPEEDDHTQTCPICFKDNLSQKMINAHIDKV